MRVRWAAERIRYGLSVVASTKSGLASLAIIVAYALMAIIGPLMIPFDVTRTNLSESLLPPSLEHPLGTDYFGRDILAMLVHGSRDVLLTATLAAIITVSVGTAIGLVAGYVGGFVDLALMSIADVMLTIPSVPLMVVLACTVFRGIPVNPFTMALILSVNSWAGLSRAIRAQVLSLKEEEFVEVARCLGLSGRHILLNELLPNLLPYIAISTVLSVGSAIYAQVGLYMLGIVPYSAVNWGVMLNMAMAQLGMIFTATYAGLLAPAFAIVLLQVSLAIFASSLDKLLNPRLREQ